MQLSLKSFVDIQIMAKHDFVGSGTESTQLGCCEVVWISHQHFWDGLKLSKN